MSFSTWHVDYESLSGLCSTDLILRFDFLDDRKNDCTNFKIDINYPMHWYNKM